jgi:hypothetical protein
MPVTNLFRISMLKVSGDQIDRPFLEQKIAELGLNSQWAIVLKNGA